MSQKRVGCYACFQTLDPKDKNLQLRLVVQCENCGALYHATCAEGLACYRCAGQKFRKSRIARPAPLRHTTRERAQTIKPSTVLVIDSGEQKNSRQSGKSEKSGISPVAVIIYLLQTLWAVILALILVAIATTIGVYGYPLLQLPFFSPQTVMDALFRSAPPQPQLVIGAVISGLIAAFVLYSRLRLDSRRFTYLWAGVVGWTAFNSWLLAITPTDFLRFAQEIIEYHGELLYAQGITIAATILLIPLHRAMAPIRLLPERSFPAWLNSLYGWVRLLIADAFVISVAIYFATHWLATEPQAKVADFYPINLPGNLAQMSILTATALAVALAGAALLYWPPPFRHVQWRFGFLRLLLFITGVVAIGFLYRTPSDPQTILVTLQYTGVMIFLGIPVQRALS